MNFDFNIFRKQVADVGAQARALRADLERLKRKRDDLIAAPASKEDLKAAAADLFKAQREAFATVLRAQLDVLVRKPEKLYDSDTLTGRMTLLGATGKPADYKATVHSMDIVLVGLLGPQLSQAYMAAIDAMDFDEGPTLAQRQDEIEKLNAEISGIATQLEELRSAARAAGLVIEEG